MRIVPHNCAVYGVDLGKTTFHIAGADQHGRPTLRIKLRRDALLQFFATASPARVGMEACPGSHWLARKLIAFGHDVKLIPAQFVKPYLKSNKNDTLDAEAIAEAVTRPTMRFVPVKRHEQLDMQALHRVRAQFVHQRTALVSQFRCFLLEYGIAIHTGIGMFRRDATRILADDSNDLTPTMRQLLTDLWSDFLRIDERVTALSGQIEASAKHDDVVQRLTTIPGIGPLGASALCAAIGNGKQFRSGRDLAAWIGLVPRQHTTGGKPTLLGISKRGNTYLRRLLVLGAQSCLMHLDRSRDRLGRWLDALESRMHHNKVVIALANKLARVAWVVLTRPGALYEKMDPRF